MTREPATDPAWRDPAVGAGFAAAYGGTTGPFPSTADLGHDAPVVPHQSGPPEPPEAPVDEAPVDEPPAVEPSAQADSEAHGGPELDDPPLTRDGRRARAARPARLSPGRAVAGAAVSVCGVLLGIGTLLWVTDDPQDRSGPAIEVPAAAGALAGDGLAEAPLETEQVPVDPPAVVLPPAPPPPAPPAAPPAPAAAPAAPQAPAPAAPAPAAAPARRALVVPVTVLNNSNRTGLADRAAARFQRGGWPVRLTGNFRGQIPVTTVYYDPGFEANARAFARTFRGIVRVRPRFATLPARGVVVVLTREFAA